MCVCVCVCLSSVLQCSSAAFLPRPFVTFRCRPLLWKRRLRLWSTLALGMRPPLGRNGVSGGLTTPLPLRALLGSGTSSSVRASSPSLFRAACAMRSFLMLQCVVGGAGRLSMVLLTPSGTHLVVTLLPPGSVGARHRLLTVRIRTMYQLGGFLRVLMRVMPQCLRLLRLPARPSLVPLGRWLCALGLNG